MCSRQYAPVNLFQVPSLNIYFLLRKNFKVHTSRNPLVPITHIEQLFRNTVSSILSIFSSLSLKLQSKYQSDSILLI